jgi:hypothetical protein
VTSVNLRENFPDNVLSDRKERKFHNRFVQTRVNLTFRQQAAQCSLFLHRHLTPNTSIIITTTTTIIIIIIIATTTETTTTTSIYIMSQTRHCFVEIVFQRLHIVDVLHFSANFTRIVQQRQSTECKRLSIAINIILLLLLVCFVYLNVLTKTNTIVGDFVDQRCQLKNNRLRYVFYVGYHHSEFTSFVLMFLFEPK